MLAAKAGTALKERPSFQSRAERMSRLSCRPPRLTLHEAFFPPDAARPNWAGRSGRGFAAGHFRRPATRSRGDFFLFNPDIEGARRTGRAFVHIRARAWRRRRKDGTARVE